MREEKAKKDAIRDAEMAKKDAEMTAMKVQMDEMLKSMKNIQQTQQPPASFAASFASVAAASTNPSPAAASRGRGRGKGQAHGRGGQVGGRGRGRGGANTNTKAMHSVSDFLISSQSTRSSQSKKRGEMSHVNENSSEKSKFWSDLDSGDDTEQPDPRKSEDWKIQRKKDFQKD